MTIGMGTIFQSSGMLNLKLKLDKVSFNKKIASERRKLVFEWVKTGHIDRSEFEFILDNLVL